MPSNNVFFFTLKKCQAKLVSVRLNEMKFRARTRIMVIELRQQFYNKLALSLI